MAEQCDVDTKAREFLTTLSNRTDLGSENPLPIVGAVTRVWEFELEGQVISVCKSYLAKCECPSVLLYPITGAVLSRIKSNVNLDLPIQSGEIPADEERNRSAEQYKYFHGKDLTKCIVDAIHHVCIAWDKENPLSNSSLNSPMSNHCSVKNSRRKMEDRHLICPDVNALFQLKDMPEQCFYGVFDGHSGIDAADFASVNLICNLTRHKQFLTDIEKAMKDAFLQTDRDFCAKARAERWKSGTTCVCAFTRENQLTIGWAGDSQALLIRKGQPVPVMFPHKPDRVDEKERIEEAGSAVLWLAGSWRVDGILSVARSIGDLDHKPAVTGEPDIITLECDGSEDFLILACDGVWDVIDGDALADIVRVHVKNGGDKTLLPKVIVDQAKTRGSSDNITVIVVCFKHASGPPSRQGSGSVPTTPEHTPAQRQTAIDEDQGDEGTPAIDEDQSDEGTPV